MEPEVTEAKIQHAWETGGYPGQYRGVICVELQGIFSDNLYLPKTKTFTMCEYLVGKAEVY